MVAGRVPGEVGEVDGRDCAASASSTPACPRCWPASRGELGRDGQAVAPVPGCGARSRRCPRSPPAPDTRPPRPGRPVPCSARASRRMYSWNHRSGLGRLGDRLDGGGGHRGQRVGQAVPLRRAGRARSRRPGASSACTRSGPGPAAAASPSPGTPRTCRLRHVHQRVAAGTATAGTPGCSPAATPPRRRRRRRSRRPGAGSAGVPRRAGRRCHGRRRAAARRVELDRLHTDQLANLRCPHDKDDIESPMPSRQGR